MGSLVQIMIRYFQKCGHRPIVLMGGGTTKGYSSGKDDARQLLNENEIEKNKQGIKTVFEILNLKDGPSDAIMR